ncbi:MAG: TlpA disulfide reductase family protein [Bacteroidota bacterium]
MKNSIQFYVLLVAVVFGGVKWTAHSILEKKKAVLEKTNFNTEIQKALVANGEPELAAQVKGKTVVLYDWNKYCDHCLKELPQLNKLAAEHPGVQFIGVTNIEKLETEAYLKSKKITMNFPQVEEKNDWRNGLMIPIAPVYAEESQEKGPDSGKPVVLIIDGNGKVKWCTGGERKNLVEEIRKAI